MTSLICACMLYGKRYYAVVLFRAYAGTLPPPYYRRALTNVRGTWDAVVIRLGGSLPSLVTETNLAPVASTCHLVFPI